ncbi:bifunctional serine/threonine-protein kinase/formylglycine-generating enzyme family protein [Hyalangium versicolor]|uniref:bifunctional serine/threonine-protein kinase/formylglycine-generating enzyme family protein n=1 Tax=Hyalangium versicolor TaxID=2861190 RepID=UPI001CCDE1B1|nr:bifunctional serine/threonine-protein kinase/formylglycine-generating enzyme family protein [Hyalangium versicolor]
MLCYRCGSHVPETTDTCPTCGQKFDASARQASGASTRKRGGGEGAPYKSGDIVAGRYVVQDMVGAGPVGYVFRVLDRANDVEVALKAINPRLLQEPEERTQFSLVLKVGKKLNHPYLSRVYEEGFDQERPYFTSQLIDGMTLRRMMEMRAAKGQPFTLREVEPLLSQLASALDAAHRYGPHSDLKPENIIVLPDLLKVTDYGLALGLPRPPYVQAQKGYRADAYIAPEYVSGSEIDSRMDLYSLAVIVGEMLTGLMPDADGIPEVLMKNPDLPPAFEALYRRALNSNPLVRPKSAGEFAAEFSSILSKGAGKRAPPQAPPLGNSALSDKARTSEKPPPPVPTDQLPIVSLSPPIPSRPSLEHDAPVDATQPMDAAMLAAIMAAPPGSTLRPDGTIKPPEPRPSAESRGGKSSPTEPPVSSPSSASAGNPPRAAPAEKASAVSGARQAVKPAVARPVVRKVEKRPLPTLGLVLLTIAGLATGAGVGFLLLKRMGAQGGGDPTPVPPPVSQPVPPAPPASPQGSPMALAARCPQDMKQVSGGTFKRGAPPNEKERMADERLLESVQVSTFCIDEYEYPNKEGDLPLVNVTWEQARQACESKQKRLCSEEEWEKACKGPGNALFPYANEFNASACNTKDANEKDRALAVAGHFAGCRSGYQVADLSGNVAEWTASPFAGNNPNKTLKGGAFNRTDSAVRCSARTSGEPDKPEPTVGFRCCAGVQQ